MEILGKTNGYNVVGIGSVDSKSYYMQRKDIETRIQRLSQIPSNSATIQDMAWQFGTNMDSVGRDNIERVLLGNSTN